MVANGLLRVPVPTSFPSGDTYRYVCENIQTGHRNRTEKINEIIVFRMLPLGFHPFCDYLQFIAEPGGWCMARPGWYILTDFFRIPFVAGQNSQRPNKLSWVDGSCQKARDNFFCPGHRARSGGRSNSKM